MRQTLPALILLLSLFLQYRLTAQDYTKCTWKHYDTLNSPLPDNHLRDARFDSKGNLWVTTGNRHLLKFDGKNWKECGHPPFVTGFWFNSVYIDKNDNVWISGEEGKLLFYNEQTGWDTIPFSGMQPWHVWGNEKGVILVGMNNNGQGQLYEVRNKKTTLLESTHQDVFNITVLKNGDALVAFRDGLFKYHMNSDGTYQHDPEKLSDLAMYETHPDSKGNLWSACYSTLSLQRYDGTGWTDYPDGPPEIFYDFNGAKRYIIYNAIVLPDDRVFISTQFGADLALFDGKKWTPFVSPWHDDHDEIFSAERDKDGNIWCTTHAHGLVVLMPGGKKKQAVADSIPVPPKTPTAFLPDTTRRIKTSGELVCHEKTITLSVYDSKKIDGDTISLYFNGEALLKNFPLSNIPWKTTLTLTPGASNDLVLFAHNLGSIPPNTATLKIIENGNAHIVNLNSDLENCDRLSLRWEQ